MKSSLCSLKCYFCRSRVHTYWPNVFQCVNGSLYFVGMVFKAWLGSQMNNPGCAKIKAPSNSNTVLPLSPRLSVWKWLPRGSREVRRWAPCTRDPPLHSHTNSIARHNPLGEVLPGWQHVRRETLAIQSPTPISIPDLIVLYRRQESLCKRYMDLCVLRSLVSGFGFSAHTRCRAPLSRWERRRAVSHGVSGVGDWR